jgi:error-prone DNA polymerase
VPLFQEQAMKLAMVAANFSADEVNQLRKAMATFRRRGMIDEMEEKMVGRMVKRGYEKDFAWRCFNQIKGFGEYGFPESHAASFAHLVYVSAWIKRRYPAVFAAALLNSQPMGFYAPAQIVRDAAEHGVEVRAPDVNVSTWDCTLEGEEEQSPILRLGLRLVEGLARKDADLLVARRIASGYVSLAELQSRAGVPASAIEKLAAADAFRSLGIDRRGALWDAKGLAASKPLPLFAHAEALASGEEPPVALPPMPASEHIINDYQTLRLSLKGHPMQFLREKCRERRVADNEALKRLKDRARVAVAGVVLVRQRPGTAGVVFITLEDEFAVCNIVVWPRVFERFRSAVMGARVLLVHGRIQKAQGVIHVVAERMENLTCWLAGLSEELQAPPVPLARADAVARPAQGSRHPSLRHPRNVRILPGSRDFH